METYTRKDERGVWRLPETENNLIALMKGIEIKLGVMLAMDAILAYILVLVGFSPTFLVSLYSFGRFALTVFQLIYYDDAFRNLYFRDSTYILLSAIIKLIFVLVFASLRTSGWSGLGRLVMLPVVASSLGAFLFALVERPIPSVRRCYKMSRSVFVTAYVTCLAIDVKYARWFSYIGLLSSSSTSVVSLIIAASSSIMRPLLVCLQHASRLVTRLNRPAVNRYHRRFVYSPIEKPSGIRLVILERRWPFSPIKLTLYEVSLDDEPDYETISYSWGKTDIAKMVLVNGSPMLVPKATYRVLSTRASLFRTRSFWIDFICINQEDLVEKGLQVQQMTRIFKSAWRVLVFLEGSTLDAFMAFSLLQELLAFVRDEKLSGQQIMNNCLFERFGLRWRCLDHVLKQTWFSRIWVVQEIAVAKSVDVICGGLYLDFDMLKDMAKLITLDPVLSILFKSAPAGFISHINLGHLEFMTGIGDSVKILPKVQMAVRLGILMGDVMFDKMVDATELQMTDRLAFSSLLRHCTGFGATDARDRLFAFFGLAKDYPSTKQDRVQGQDGEFEELLRDGLFSQRRERRGRVDLTPDYQRSVRELFIEVARYFIENNEPFICFSRAGLTQRSDESKSQQLPTWATDWSSHSTRGMLNPGFTTVPYNAGSDSEVLIHVGEGPESSICYVHSKFASKIQRLGTAFPKPDTENDDEFFSTNGIFTFPNAMLGLINWHDQALELARESGHGSRSLPAQHLGAEDQEDILIEAFWRTLVGNKSLTGDAPDEFARDYCKWVKLMNEGRQCTIRALERGTWMQSTNTPIAPQDPILTTDRFAVRFQALHAFSNALNIVAAGRRFSVCEDGRMGMVPDDAQIGDEVHVFSGSQIPVLLRRAEDVALGANEDWFCVVGECYVGGIMDGQLYEDDLVVGRNVKLI